VIENTVQVHVQGPVTEEDREHARSIVRHAAARARGPLLHARVDLVAHTDPARERPAFAKCELDVNGQIVRAHATGAVMRDALDGLDERLRERLRRAAQHQRAEHLRHRDPGHWRHGDQPTVPEPVFPRPVEEREIVRRKTFAATPMTLEQAAVQLHQLDHDFFLFTDADLGLERVVACRDGGHVVIDEPTVRTVEEAVEALALSGARFVFFREPGEGRGQILYRRYDGHYGLITPAAD
jgi:hypothetical protein